MVLRWSWCEKRSAIVHTKKRIIGMTKTNAYSCVLYVCVLDDGIEVFEDILRPLSTSLSSTLAGGCCPASSAMIVVRRYYSRRTPHVVRTAIMACASATNNHSVSSFCPQTGIHTKILLQPAIWKLRYHLLRQKWSQHTKTVLFIPTMILYIRYEHCT